MKDNNCNKAEAAQQSSALFEYILEGEYEAANLVLYKWAQKNSYHSAILDILEPVLEKIGNLWDKEQISLAAGYLAGKVAENILTLTIEHEQCIPLNKGPVIIGNIEDDYHSLGRKLLGICLTTAGWKVIDLGNDVTPKEFIDSAVENNAHVIGISAMMFTTAQNIIGVRKEIDCRGLTNSIKLAVGGAIFKIRPELVKEVGGDGTASNAINAPELFNRLLEESKK